MLLPIGDDNSDRRLTPFINYILILINILVFIFLQGRSEAFTNSYAAIPEEIMTNRDLVGTVQLVNPLNGETASLYLGHTGIPVYLTLITSMFMHGGWAHLFGNLLYLWVFGDNLENVMGHKRYLLFYLLCGVLAGMAHVLTTAYMGGNTYIPSLGASGAISGVLGGYLLLFPRRSVHVWFLWFILSVPAFLALGLWIVFQVINGMGTLGGEKAGGIAYAAHIGGFVAGFLLVKLFARREALLYTREKRGIFSAGRRSRRGWY